MFAVGSYVKFKDSRCPSLAYKGLVYRVARRYLASMDEEYILRVEGINSGYYESRFEAVKPVADAKVKSPTFIPHSYPDLPKSFTLTEFKDDPDTLPDTFYFDESIEAYRLRVHLLVDKMNEEISQLRAAK